MATTVYIDGFNLYYGALRGTPYKWLDLEALCRRLLPKDVINGIRYFTARITARPDDPQQAQRQEIYLRALKTFPLITLHFGHFLTHPVRLPLAQPHPRGPRTAQVLRTEEKGSDVNLASHLLLDGFQRNCDTAVVMSNDSDLRVPIRIAEQVLSLRVGIVNPQPAASRSRALKATFFKQLRESTVAECQLPEVIIDAQGEIGKPDRW
jgi:uncharacterized LabA/DUF88 family protein